MTRAERFVPIASSRTLYGALSPLRPGTRIGAARFRRLAFDPARRAWWLDFEGSTDASAMPALYLEVARPDRGYVARSRTLGLVHQGVDSPAALHEAAHRVAGWIAAREAALAPDAWEAVLADVACGVLVASGDRIDVRLTRACNEDCPMCNSTGDLDNLVTDLERLRAALPRLRALDVTSITYTGGEPTLVSWLPDAIALAHAAGFDDVCVQTNALRFADPAFLEAFEGPRRPERFLVSFHAHCPETYEAIVGRTGTFARAIGGLRALARAGHAVELNHVLQAANAADVEAFVEFCATELGAAVSILFCVVAPLGRQREHPDALPRYSDLVPGLERALVRAGELGLSTHVAELCGLPRCVLDGSPLLTTATACHEPAFPDLKVHLPRCERCRYREACSGVWREYLDVHGDTELVPVDVVREHS